MFPTAPADRPLQLSFVLLPRFSMMAFAAAFEPLRAANRMAGAELYRRSILSPDGRPVTSSSGVSVVADGALDGLPAAAREALDVLIVVASYEPERHFDRALKQCLHRAVARGAWLVGVDTGPQLLAAAGLLDGYQATAHWEIVDMIQQRHPAVRLTQDVFVIDRKRWTAAGGTACLDLMLNLIRQQHGHELATAVADQFIYSRIRHGSDTQRMQPRERLAVNNPRVLEAVRLMEANLEEPLPTLELALAAGISLRELERLFRRWLGTTPGAYYRQLRLERARSLLQQSAHSVTEIALACGFGSLASFSRAYKARFGQPPSASRVLSTAF